MCFNMLRGLKGNCRRNVTIVNFSLVRHVPPPVRPLRCVVAGACSRVGQPLSLLLKQRGLPSELVLYDSTDTAPLLADLALVQSESRIFAFSGPEKLVHALTVRRMPWWFQLSASSNSLALHLHSIKWMPKRKKAF